MDPARTELLAAVERSSRAVAEHDRAGWVALFTGDGRIDDPVGSRPHIGRVQIERFYDTFIGPRQIAFHRDVDIVNENTVIRDLTLGVTMASSVTMMIPAFLRYDLRPADGGWQIERLRAYWELAAMTRQFLGRGGKSLAASIELSIALLRNQGVGGAAGFLSGFGGAGPRGKRLVEESLADGRLGSRLQGCRWDKMITAGRTVATSISTDSDRGVLFAEISRAGTGINRTHYFGGAQVGR